MNRVKWVIFDMFSNLDICFKVYIHVDSYIDLYLNYKRNGKRSGDAT